MKTKITEPIPYAGAYWLDLYCDHENEEHGQREFPHEFHGHTFANCMKQARDRGWVVHADRTATCPKCSGKKRRTA